MGICEKKFFNIDQGEDKDLEMYLVDKDSGEPVDLTEPGEITARFKKSDGTLLEKTLTDEGVAVVSIPGAKIKVSLTDSDTSSLAVDVNQDFEIEVVVGDVTTILKFEKALTVKAALA